MHACEDATYNVHDSHEWPWCTRPRATAARVRSLTAVQGRQAVQISQAKQVLVQVTTKTGCAQGDRPGGFSGLYVSGVSTEPNTHGMQYFTRNLHFIGKVRRGLFFFSPLFMCSSSFKTASLGSFRASTACTLNAPWRERSFAGPFGPHHIHLLSTSQLSLLNSLSLCYRSENAL
jgi:hypothetical protein